MNGEPASQPGGGVAAFFDRHQGSLENPGLLSQTLTALRDPDCAAERLVQLLEREPAASSKILKLANSSLFGTPKAITSLKGALVRLGNRNISRLLLASSLRPKGGASLERWMPFWRHSLAVGMLSRHMGSFLGEFSRQEQDELFTMGMLHDLGIYIEMVAPEFDQVAASLAKRPTPLEEVERAVFGFDHQQLGVMAAIKWNFPGDLCHAIGHHHQPEKSGAFYRRIAVVHLADAVSHGIGIHCVPNEAPPAAEESCMQALHLPVEQLVLFGEWLDSQRSEIDSLGSALAA